MYIKLGPHDGILLSNKECTAGACRKNGYHLHDILEQPKLTSRDKKPSSDLLEVEVGTECKVARRIIGRFCHYCSLQY